MKYPLVSIKSGDDEKAGIWVSIGFSSKERNADVLHLVGGDPVSPQHVQMGWLPLYLERYDQGLSCYQGADKIMVEDGSITITLNKAGQSALHLPKTLEFVSAKADGDFKKARSDLGGHLGEHGLSIYLRKGRWRWSEADYFINYQGGFQEVPELTPAERVRTYAKEMRKMAAEFEALVSGPEQEKRRWEKLFPAPPPGARVQTDPSILYGDWKLDPEETARVLTKLGEKTSVTKARENWKDHLCRISRKALKLFEGDDLFQVERVHECRRRGNRFSILLDTGSTWEYWCDGKLLVDDTGLAWRRAC